MSSASGIDQIRGPHDGVVELIILQHADWESDPFLVKQLREKVTRYQTYLVGEFLRTYANCQGAIILETSHFPPEEIQQYLAKEGIEVRIAEAPAPIPHIDKVRDTGSAVELIISQPVDWDADPFLLKQIRERIASYKAYIDSPAWNQAYPGKKGLIVVESLHAPPPEVLQRLAIDGADVRGPDEEAPAPAKAPATAAALPGAPGNHPAPAAPAALAPVPEAPTPAPATEAPKKPMFVERTPPPVQESWENDDFDDDMGMEAVPTSGPPMMLIVSGVICVLCLIAAVYGFMSSSAPEVGAPKAVSVGAVDGSRMPKETYATVSARPDRSTFVIIPLQGRKSAAVEYYFLFSTVESRNLLIFAKKSESQIVKEIKMVPKPLDDEEKVPKPVWYKDLLGPKDKVNQRTYTGRLERAKRRKHGPLELVLPDGNRNINTIFKRQGIKFPSNAMVLVVGEKPRPPSNSGNVIGLISLLCALIAGGVAFASLGQSKRAF